MDEQTLAKDRVHRGAQLLDKERPGWWQEIEQAAGIEMASTEACILGTLFGGYVVGLVRLFGNNDQGRADWSDVEYGFDTDTEVEYSYGDLHRYWEHEVRVRAMKVQHG